MWNLYSGPRRVVARMESVCGFLPGRGYDCRARLDSRPCTSEHAPAIRRSIWSGPLCFPNPVVGREYISELLCLYLYDEVVRASIRLELPFCHGHVVVGQPHYALMVQAPTPRHRIGVTICTSGNT